MREVRREPARRRNPADSRRRILDAAESAFALRGYGGARLREIAQEAGVHHALVHHYYADKRGLLHEVVKRGLERMAQAGRAALDPPVTLEGTVRAFVGVLFDFCAGNRGLMRILDETFRDRELGAYDVTRETLHSFVAPLLHSLRQTIEFGQLRGFVRRDISVESLMLLGFGAIVHRFHLHDSALEAMGWRLEGEADLAAAREHAIRYVLAAMAVQDVRR